MLQMNRYSLLCMHRCSSMLSLSAYFIGQTTQEKVVLPSGLIDTSVCLFLATRFRRTISSRESASMVDLGVRRQLKTACSVVPTKKENRMQNRRVAKKGALHSESSKTAIPPRATEPNVQRIPKGPNPTRRPSATGVILPFCLPLFTSPTRPKGGDPYSLNGKPARRVAYLPYHTDRLKATTYLGTSL